MIFYVFLQLLTLFLQLEMLKQFSSAAPNQLQRPLFPGDYCSQPIFGDGVCLFECPEFKKNIDASSKLKICNYVGSRILMCCPTSFEQFKEKFVWVLNVNFAHQRFDVQKILPAIPRELIARSQTLFNDIIEQKKKTYEKEEEYKQLPFGRASKKMCKIYSQMCKPPIFISHGTQVKSTEFGHEAAIGFVSKNVNEIEWACGGTIISSKYILTAAHCVYNFEWGPATWVRVGGLNLRSDGDGMPQNHKIVQKIKHPLFKSSSFYHDIALLEVQTPILFNDYVRPACLSIEEKVEETIDHGIVTGWGSTHSVTINRSEILMKAEVPIVNNEDCNPYYANFTVLKNGILPEYQICAGANGRDACQGDSGGPLFVRNEEEKCVHNIVGITSFGLGCGNNAPGVYTRVYNYISWIENIVWPDVVKSMPVVSKKPQPTFYLLNSN